MLDALAQANWSYFTCHMLCVVLQCVTVHLAPILPVVLGHFHRCSWHILCVIVLQRRQQLAGAQVVIASSDSDMQQLLDDSTYWLEMQQVRWGLWSAAHG
jgi:hypothetical protein